MKLATFTHDGAARLGVVIDEEIVDLAAAAPDLPRDRLALLQAGPAALDAARERDEAYIDQPDLEWLLVAEGVVKGSVSGAGRR